MNILEMATQAGLQVLLDARIGSQTYHSVSGSLPALQRFADSVKTAALEETSKPARAKRATKERLPRSRAAMRARRAQRRALLCRRLATNFRPSAATFHSRAG